MRKQILLSKMLASAYQTSEPCPNTHRPISSTENALIALNSTAQINEISRWRAQFEALLLGYNLLDYVNGISQCPSPVGTSPI